MKTVEQKLADIRTALESMPVGNCGVKWDCMVWRVEGGFIVGETGVRKDAFIHSIESAVEWFAWKRKLPITFNHLAKS